MRPYTGAVDDPELLAAWIGIAVTAVIGSVGWILAAKANRQLTKTHRLARRAQRTAATALRRAADASRSADEAGRVSARVHALIRRRTEQSVSE
jgi:hypothetical protein